MKDFSDAVHAIHDAALSSERWPVALSLIGKMFDAEGAVVIFYDRNAQADFICSEGLRHAVRIYQDENWWTRDIHAQRALEAHVSVGDVFDDFSVATEDEIGTLPIYTDFFERVGFGWLMSCVVLPDIDMLVALSVPRARTKGRFAPEEMERLRLIGRHVEQSLRLSVRLAAFEATEAAFRTALDALEIGVFALDPDGRLVLANASGRTLCDSLFATRAGRMVPQAESERPRFEATLAAARHIEPGASPPRPCVLTGADGRKNAIWALPVTETGERRIGAGDPIRHLILATPVERGQRVDPVLLRDAFGLTLGEARVAALVGGGSDIREAAGHLAIAEGTVRIVLKRVFRKLGINRQAELVLRLSHLGAVAPCDGRALAQRPDLG